MGFRSLCLLLALVFVVLAAPVKRSFHGNKVFRVVPTHADHLAFLQQQYEQNRELDFWTEPLALGRSVDVHMPQHLFDVFHQNMSQLGMNVETFIENVQQLVEEQLAVENPDDFYSSYHTYEDVIAWIQQQATQYPNLTKLVTLGKSYEGRTLLALQVTSSKNPDAGKVGLWFDGCIHAREWIATATVVYMLGNFLSDYGKDATVTSIIDNSVLTVLPIFNPDGYAYTWATDRMWRKTRSPNPGSSCIGTDPNRNWDYQWNGAGVSHDPCSESYLGQAAFSEIEVKTVGLYLKNQGNFRGYINFHSYSELWMSPWGYTSQLPKDYTVQNTLSKQCVAALAAVNGEQYSYGPIATTIYPASGSSADYTYGAANILYSYGVELRDKGQYGFLLPPRFILPSGTETYAAVKVWAQAAIKSNQE